MTKKLISLVLVLAMTLTLFAGLTLNAHAVGVEPEDGKAYVVAVLKSDSTYYALTNQTSNGSTLSSTEVTLNADGKVNTADAENLTWTLEENSETSGQFYIKYTSGTNTYYLYKNGTSTSNKNFAVNKTSKNYWSFSGSASAGYTVTAIDRGSNRTQIECSSGTWQCSNTGSSIFLLEVGDVSSGGDQHNAVDTVEVAEVPATCIQKGTAGYYTCQTVGCEKYNKKYSDENLENEVTDEDLLLPYADHVDDNADGKCDNCNLVMYALMTEDQALRDGDEVIIYNAGAALAVTSTANGAKLKGGEIINRSNVATSETAAALTVEYAEDDNTNFYLKSADGEYLTAPTTGNGLSLNEEPSDYSLWYLEDLGSANFAILNKNASYTLNNIPHKIAIEYFNGFTSYTWYETELGDSSNSSTSANYQMNLFVKHNDLIDIYVINETNDSSVRFWAWGNAGNINDIAEFEDRPDMDKQDGKATADKENNPHECDYYKITIDKTKYGDGLIFTTYGDQVEVSDYSADAATAKYLVYSLYYSNVLTAAKVSDVWFAGEQIAATCTTNAYIPYTGLLTGETWPESAPVGGTGHDYVYTYNNNGTHTVTCSRGDIEAEEFPCDWRNGACVCGSTEPAKATVNFVANGEVYGEPVTDYIGKTIQLPAGVTAPEGYTFGGWVETEIVTETTEMPVIYTGSYVIPEEGATLYALYSRDEGEIGTATVYQLVSTITSGKNYIFASKNEAGTAYALDAAAEDMGTSNNSYSNTVAGTPVVIIESGSNKQIIDFSDSYVFNLTGNIDVKNMTGKTKDLTKYLAIGGSGFAVYDTVYSKLGWSDEYGLCGNNSKQTTQYYVYLDGTSFKKAADAPGRVYAFEETEVQIGTTYYATQISVSAKPEITDASITLGNAVNPTDGDLLLNFYISNLDVADISKYQVKFASKNGANDVEETVDLEFIEGKGIRASYPVFMKNYDQDVVAELLEKDTDDPIDTNSYNIKAYLQQLISNETFKPIASKLMNLCELVKGELISNYTPACTENAFSNIIDDANEITELCAFTEPTAYDNVKFYGMSLLMKESITLRVYFQFPQGDEPTSVTIDEVGDKSLTRKGTSNYWYYDITGFTHDTLDNEHTVRVTCGTNTVTLSGLSTLSYAYRVVTNGKYENTDNLYKLVCILYEYCMENIPSSGN